MAMIGNPIVSTDFPVDYKSGNGSTTAFTLSIAPASVNSIDVQISGVSQSPQTYSVSGTTLTFSAAPPTGTNNIVVRHLGIAGIPNVPSAGSVVPSSIGTGYSLWNLSGSDVNYTAGNVGIGTASPSGKLTVYYSTNGAYNTGVNIQNGNSGSGATTSFQLTNDAGNRAGAYLTSSTCSYYGGTNTFNLGTVESIPFTFLTGNSERMRITTNGRVLINNTGSFGGNLQSTGIGGIAAAASFKPGNNGDGTVEFYNASNGYVSAIQVNASTVNYGTGSDYRLKNNIQPLSGGLSKVMSLKPSTWTWNRDGSQGQGFIAHELQEVVPDCVSGVKDGVKQDGTPEYQGVDTSFLVATLTAAIQELKAELDATKTEVAALKAGV